eukprot:scaffold16445_cov25-Phaeocystis_antarctica.AAC.1
MEERVPPCQCVGASPYNPTPTFNPVSVWALHPITLPLPLPSTPVSVGCTLRMPAMHAVHARPCSQITILILTLTLPPDPNPNPDP